jgi:hypothetical protein
VRTDDTTSDFDETLGRRLTNAIEAGEGDWNDVVERASAAGRPPGRSRGGRRRGRGHGRRLALALALVALVAAPAFALRHQVADVFSSSPPTDGAPSAAPGLLPGGWSVLRSDPQRLSPRGTQAETTLTSWDYRSAPDGPAGSLPPGGIIINVALLRSQVPAAGSANLCRSAPTAADYPPRSLPLRLPQSTRFMLEGAAAAKEFRVFGSYQHHNYNFEVRVDIDTRRPLGPSWAVAQRVVAGLQFPTWPRLSRC